MRSATKGKILKAEGYTKMVKIAVLGGTGRVGAHFVKYALEDGHEVRLLARSPQKVEEADGLEVLKGDATSLDDVTKLVEGTDLVVCAIGNAESYFAKKIMAKTAQNIVEAAPKRIFFITSIGLGGSGTLAYLVLHLLIGRGGVKDYQKADSIIRSADCPYIVVRPSSLTDKKTKGKYKATTAAGGGAKAISRKDVALFMRDAITETKWDSNGVQLHPADD